MSLVSDGLTPRARQLFMEQFEKDLKFFQLFFLLINKSCPVKKIDLVWAEHGPAGRVGVRRLMGTADALTSSCSRLLQAHESPDPPFCNIINDRGRHEAESCGISDKAAEERVRISGKPQVYRCHAGLVDIAVPVFCEGEHIATLLTGQVLKEQPTRAGLAQILRSVEHLAYINRGALAKAYWEVPVVSEEQIQNTVEVLEVFAEFVSNSWKRLWDAVREQVRRSRELPLCRKEFAALALADEAADRQRIRELLSTIGLRHYPSRVMAVKLESEDEYQRPGRSFDLAFTAALQAIEELCDRLENVTCAYLRRRGMCIFFSERDLRHGGSAEVGAHSLARDVLNSIAARSDMCARVGIGGGKRTWHELVDSYHEACLALAASNEPIATFRKRPPSLEALSVSVESLSRFIASRQWKDASVAVRSLPLLVHEHLGNEPQTLELQRHFFASALDSMCISSQKLGCDTAVAIRLRMEANRKLDRAATIFELQGAFLESAENILEESRRLFLGRREKIVDRTRRTIERELSDHPPPQQISISRIASELGISVGHLSRTFRQAVGMTFERYLSMQRVEAAKRLLLDPAISIAGVAERCGFSDPTYFARVFRKIAGCTPSSFRSEPEAFPPERSEEPGTTSIG